MRESNPLNLFFSFVPGLVITIKLPLRPPRADQGSVRFSPKSAAPDNYRGTLVLH